MTTTTTKNLDNHDQSSFFDLHNESSLSSCSSSPPTSLKPIHNLIENDSGCGSDDDPALALKINKGLSMGYDYELIKSVIQQQNDGDDMSKFIETIVRTAEVNGHSTTPPPSSSSSNKIYSSTSTDTDCSDTSIQYDVYIIDGADLAFRLNKMLICLKDSNFYF
jgi:hypothetical protein